MVKLLVNTQYGNGVNLREQNQSLYCCQSHKSIENFYKGLDLSEEVLKVSVDQRAAKL